MLTKPGNGGHGLETYDPKNGQYVEDGKPNKSYDNPEEKIESNIDFSDEGEFSYLNDIDLSDSGDFSYLDDMDLTKETSNEEAEELFTLINDELFDEENKNSILTLPSEDKLALLENSSSGYDLEKLKKLSNEELNMLAAIEKVYALKSNINLLKSELENKKFESAWKYETYTNVKDYNVKQYSVESKIKFLTEELEKHKQNNDFLDIHLTESKLKETLAYKEAGEKYLDLNLKDEKIAELEVFNNLKKVKERYLDLNSTYGEHRKNKAVWIKNNDGFNSITQLAKMKFGSKATEIWENATKNEKDAIYEYTQSYHKYNEPLRGKKYIGGKSFPQGMSFREAVENMTNIIDKSSYDEDIWVQRGIDSDVAIFQNNSSKKLSSLGSMSDSQLQSLVGTTFKENGFFSSGAGKDTGFSEKDVILNTYCPRGTKMMYMNIHGAFKNTSENEMLLQRGYSYRITKVEKVGGRYYLDCEVLLDSNKDIPKGEELDKLWEQNTSKVW